MTFFSGKIARALPLILALNSTVTARPIQIIDGDAPAPQESATITEEAYSPILQETLEALIDSIGFSARPHEKKASEIIAKLMAQPQDEIRDLAICICKNWGAQNDDAPGTLSLDARQAFPDLHTLHQSLQQGNTNSPMLEHILAEVALATLMHGPTAAHLNELGACIATIDKKTKADDPAPYADAQQPLLHRFAALLTTEIRLAEQSRPLISPISLVIKYLVASGTNINSLNNSRETALDMVLDELYPHREKDTDSLSECTLYRRPSELVTQRNTHQKGGSAAVAAATALIKLGARHGVGYLRNTKRQPITTAAANRAARLFCSTPYTTLADALLSCDEELLNARADALRRREVLSSLMQAVVISGNATLLRQLVHYGANLSASGPALWAALCSPLHNEADLLADANELLYLRVPLNKRDALGNTPLHFIVAAAAQEEPYSPHWKLVALLLKNGASMNARNARGETPLSLANHALEKFMLQSWV
ncbi:MAG: hypothetical protein PVJ92_01420 [Candidatus Dependentiae bacterium]